MIRYTFKDHRERSCSITWKLNKAQTDQDIHRFGIPKSMFEPFPDVPQVHARRKQMLERGLVMRRNKTLIVDKNAMISAYSSYTKILADWMIQYLPEYDTDTRLNRIQLAMRFVQDIPYGVPDDIDPNWYYGGVIATPNIFTCGYGDCDTKAILFAGILCHLIDPDDIRFAGEPGHIYTIIRGGEEILLGNGKTAGFFRIDGRKFYVAETAGPGRFDFGEKGSQRYRSAKIERVVFEGIR